TLVPHFARPGVAEMAPLLAETDGYSYWRDYWFPPYQGNLTIAMGLIGGFVAAWCLTSMVLRRRGKTGITDAVRTSVRRRGAWFWWILVVVATLLGIAVHGSLDRLGVAHICLQPLVLLGVAAVAANFARFAPALRVLIVLGAIVDFALGILLHFYVQSLPINA